MVICAEEAPSVTVLPIGDILMEMIGIECRIAELPEDISQEEFEDAFCKINKDPEVHGILLFQPLPEQLDVEKIRQMIDPAKDMDGMSPVNLAKIFEGDRTAYAPCTSEAVMHIMNHYGIELQGKRVTVIGRSMVVGKPLSMLMLGQNATVTICHSRTKDLADRCREAEIIVAAIGRAKHITADMIAEGAVVADVGINVLEDGTLCGDVDYGNVREKVSHITPVPGGVGNVTTSVLASHVLRAARIGQNEPGQRRG